MDLTVSSPDLRPSLIEALQGLAEARAIGRVVTTVGFRGDGVVMRWARRISERAEALARRRAVPPFLDELVEFVPLAEVVRQFAGRVGVGDIAMHRLWLWAEPYFDRHVARRFAARSPVLYGHEHAALASFAAQKRAGGRCVLRQVMAHYAFADRILDEEIRRFPSVETAYQRELRAGRSRVNERKQGEYELADLIIANSEFVRRTFVLSGVEPNKVVAIPTGCPPPVVTRARRPAGKVLVLSVGHLSLRKGTLYLLEAWRRVAPPPGTAELRLAGKAMLPPSVLAELPAGTRLEGLVSGTALDALYRQASVLVLPTLCEGLAHVIPEAMSRGLPIITTPNAGAEGLVEDGVNGWTVPIRDADALAARLAWCVENPGALEAMGQRSLQKAREWSADRAGAGHATAVLQFIEDWRGGEGR